MNELNKSQIVLLTLLVSFVTSLATGIVTVSLMEQGITPVTNTVNQIVERTKEIIIRVQEPRDTLVITEKETVVVTQSDLVAKSVSKSKNSSIILYKIIPDGEVVENTTTPAAEPLVEDIDNNNNQDMVASPIAAIDTTEQIKPKIVFASRAIVLADGIIIADASSISDGEEYGVLNSDGEIVTTNVLSSHDDIVILQAKDIGIAATLGDTSTIERGQAVIMLSGTGRLRVTTTIISDILLIEGTVSGIETDKGTATPGSMLINLEGDLIGISTGTSRVNGNSWFTPGNTIEAVLHSNDDVGI